MDRVRDAMDGGDCVKPLIRNAAHYRQRRLIQVASVAALS